MEERERCFGVLKARAKRNSTAGKTPLLCSSGKDARVSQVPVQLLDQARLSVLAGPEHVFLRGHEVSSNQEEAAVAAGSVELFAREKVSMLRDIQAGKRNARRLQDGSFSRAENALLLIGEILHETKRTTTEQNESADEPTQLDEENENIGNVVSDSFVTLWKSQEIRDQYKRLFH